MTGRCRRRRRCRCKSFVFCFLSHAGGALGASGPEGRVAREPGPRPAGEVGGTGVLPVSSPTRCRTSPGARSPLPPPLPGLGRRRAGAFPFRESREPSPTTPASPPRPPDPNETPAGPAGGGGEGRPCSPRVCARLRSILLLLVPVSLRCAPLPALPGCPSRAPALTPFPRRRLLGHEFKARFGAWGPAV